MLFLVLSMNHWSVRVNSAAVRAPTLGLLTTTWYADMMVMQIFSLPRYVWLTHLPHLSVVFPTILPVILLIAVIIVPPGLNILVNGIGEVPIVMRVLDQCCLKVSYKMLRTCVCVTSRLCSWQHTISACISFAILQKLSNWPPRRSKVKPLTFKEYNRVVVVAFSDKQSPQGWFVRWLDAVSTIGRFTLDPPLLVEPLFLRKVLHSAWAVDYRCKFGSSGVWGVGLDCCGRDPYRYGFSINESIAAGSFSLIMILVLIDLPATGKRLVQCAPWR